MNIDHFALVVGIDHYPNYRSLQGANQDAEDFAAWLLNTDHGGALPPKNLKLVLSKKNSERPVHEDIDDALEEILDATDENPAKRLYIYFSGHGLARSNIGVDLCLAKWSKRRMGRALDSQDYLSLAMESGRFKEIVMLLDCCRIRKIRKRALRCTLDFARPDGVSGESTSFVGYATQFLNAAHEAATDEPEEDDTEEEDEGAPVVRGHFTRALIDALNGEAAEPTGGVTASRLKEYLDLRTPEIAKHAGHVQKPEVQNGLASVPEPTFGSAVPPQVPGVTINITFASDYGEVVLEDGNLNEIKRGASTSPWQVTLERGNYLLWVANGDASENIRITGLETGGVNVDF